MYLLSYIFLFTVNIQQIVITDCIVGIITVSTHSLKPTETLSFMNNLLNTSHCVLPMQKDYHSTFGIILCHPMTFLFCRNIYNIYNIIFITLSYLRVLYSQFLGLLKCLPYVNSIPCLCLALKFLSYVKSIPCLCYWHIM